MKFFKRIIARAVHQLARWTSWIERLGIDRQPIHKCFRINKKQNYDTKCDAKSCSLQRAENAQSFALPPGSASARTALGVCRAGDYGAACLMTTSRGVSCDFGQQHHWSLSLSSGRSLAQGEALRVFRTLQRAALGIGTWCHSFAFYLSGSIYE